MGKFIDHLSDHWPMFAAVLLVAWYIVSWLWSKIVVSPKQLTDCYDKVVKEDVVAHARIEGKIDKNAKIANGKIDKIDGKLDDLKDWLLNNKSGD